MSATTYLLCSARSCQCTQMIGPNPLCWKPKRPCGVSGSIPIARIPCSRSSRSIRTRQGAGWRHPWSVTGRRWCRQSRLHSANSRPLDPCPVGDTASSKLGWALCSAWKTMWWWSGTLSWRASGSSLWPLDSADSLPSLLRPMCTPGQHRVASRFQRPSKIYFYASTHRRGWRGTPSQGRTWRVSAGTSARIGSHSLQSCFLVHQNACWWLLCNLWIRCWY